MKEIIRKILIILTILIITTTVCSAQLLPKRGTVAEQIANSTLFNPNRTVIDEMLEFAQKHQAVLTVMERGEHWFHTAAQMKFLDDWIKTN